MAQNYLYYGDNLDILRRYIKDETVDTNPNPDRPNLTYEFLGHTKVWRWTRERMQAGYEAGLIVQTKPGAIPQYKCYLDEQWGGPLSDVWIDIDQLNSQAKERLGYPTQKPETLLEKKGADKGIDGRLY